MKQDKANYYTQAIIKYLLDHQMITTSQLSEDMDLSEKTIRTKLKQIGDMLLDNDLGKICKKPRIGIWLETNDMQKMKLKNLITNSGNIEGMQNDQMRQCIALKYILKVSKNNALTTKQLSDALYLSVPTTLKIASECKDWLKLFNIELEVIRNKGFKLSYNAVSYRLAIKHFIVKFDSDNSIDDSILFFMPGLDLQTIKKGIIDTEREWSFEFAEESFNEVLIYISLAVYLNQQQNYQKLTISNEELKMLQKYNEYNFAEGIFKKISSRFNINISKEEKAFLSIQILCSKLIDTGASGSSGDMLREYDNKLQEFVHKIISVVSNVLNVDLNNDEALYHGLLIHIRPAIFRLRYEKGHSNGLTDYIKSEYKQTFRVAWLISVLFEEYFNLKVTEDELSYIVLYIQSALGRNEIPVKTILVSKVGMGVNQMLCDKIQRSFVMIKDIKVVSQHEFKLAKCKDADLIITTSPLLESDQRIVEIDDFLSDVAIHKIFHCLKHIIEKNKAHEQGFDIICHQMFEPDLIFTHLKITSKETLLKFLCDRLVKKGYVTKNYLKSVMAREKATPTSIGNGVAIPHGDQNEINEMKIVIATLDEPILWDDEKCDVIFLLVVKMNNEYETKRTQLFYKHYINLVDSDEKVNKLKQFETNVDFYKYLVK